MTFRWELAFINRPSLKNTHNTSSLTSEWTRVSFARSLPQLDTRTVTPAWWTCVSIARSLPQLATRTVTPAWWAKHFLEFASAGASRGLASEKNASPAAED